MFADLITKTTTYDAINKSIDLYKEVRNRTESEAKMTLKLAIDEIEKIAMRGRTVAEDLKKKLNFNVSVKFNENTKSTMDKASKIIFSSLIGIAGLLSIIGVFFLIGLLCGGICPKPKKIGCCQCFSSNFGANIIWLGAIIFFIFGWLLLLLTTAMFLSGGIVEDNICRHLRDRDDSLNCIGQVIKNSVKVDIIKNSSVTFNGLLDSIEKNEAIYTTLKLTDFKELNLNNTLNLSDIRTTINKQLKRINVDLANITFLPENFENLKNGSSYIDKISIKDWLGESNKDVLSGNLPRLRNLLNDSHIAALKLVDKINETVSNMTDIKHEISK